MEDVAPVLHPDKLSSATIRSRAAGLGAAATGSLANFNRNASFRFNRTRLPAVSADGHFSADQLLPRNGATLWSGRSSSGSMGGVGDAIGGEYDDVFGGPPKLASQSMRMHNFDVLVNMSAKASGLDKGPSFSVFDQPVYPNKSFGRGPRANGGGVVHDGVLNRVPAAGVRTVAFDGFGPRFESAEPKAKAVPRMSSQRSMSFNLRTFSAEDRRGAERRTPTSADATSSEQDRSARKHIHLPCQVLESDPVVSSADSCSFSDLDPLHAQNYHFDSNEMMASSDGLAEGIACFKDILPCTPTVSSATAKSTHVSKESVEVGEPDGLTRSTGNKLSNADGLIKINFADNSVAKLINNGKYEVHGAFSNTSTFQRGEHLPQKERGNLKAGGGGSVLFQKAEENGNFDEYWITIDDIILVTQPSTTPPPSRLPPVLGAGVGPALSVSQVSQDISTSLHEISARQQAVACSRRTTRRTTKDAAKASYDMTSNAISGLKELMSGGPKLWKEVKKNVATSPFLEEEQRVGSAAAAASAAAMKDAMESAEAKFKLAKEMREKKKAERVVKTQEREKERRERKEQVQGHEREEREVRAAHEAHERVEKERSEREIEARRWQHQDMENGKARESAGTWEKEKIAFEMANEEAWGRVEAQDRAEMSSAEVCERAEMAAVERAAAEARSRAERAIVERANAEARERAQKAALERAAEAQGRAEVVAAKKMPDAGREQQEVNANDCDSSCTGDFQPSSTPKERPEAMETSCDAGQMNTSLSSDGQQKSSTQTTSTAKALTTNMSDDCMTFLAVPSFEVFQEVEGETSERRQARWERYLQTRERASKALEEKHQRDLQSQRDQAERHRVADMLDVEIKRWAVGKERNLCALLCTLQYVLWPECGWQPVSLRELNSAEAVKKVYRKATLCVHPDKVQQKGATIQQKYIAEKVFDILKEAWNQFNTKGSFFVRIPH